MKNNKKIQNKLKASAFANILMGILEEEFLISQMCKAFSFMRFIDDIF